MTSTSRSTAHSALSPYGWDEDWADAFAPYAAEGLLPGRVVRVDRGQCDVVTPDGVLRADTAFVTPHDPLRVVCTGDWVAVEPDGNPRYVRTYLPRRTAFVRSTSSKRSEGQILAANVDHAIVAVSLAVELDLARVERFLALAWESGAQPLVVLTKADLVPDPVTLAHLVQDVETSAPGVTVLAVSAALGEGLDVLAAVVGGGTAVLLGQSGAGKSTLANALLGEDVMDVQATRDVDGKGRHTTTTRNLLVMPGGGVLIDTPGLRGVGLWDAGGGVGQVFAEIEELARDCRFHDCAHESEPGCAVLAAIDDGELPERRLESYRKLMRENQRIVAKTDARLRAEIRKEWKRRGAIGKAAMEAKRGHLR
ncbi:MULTISPECIES: ribosome small subunit-dependent GTPase A [Streptomyces]|uniref:Small ribosomal subunit biogenesis GTPase RsgA n=1 Tax=Streptomyces rochei TaxID=1928 RepID=A0AAX3ZSG5_STRRO|nr:MULTISPECIES: ribosome small subunit-dependent GTPase A [Streptomyces]MBX4178760.1 ribosome small subunit-dependent GTPase A [Streptomyces geysiriensis]NUV94130.1 ribosome small subunit-dependent GTPase A [Streptomyces sp. KAI 90]PVD05631.1 ribosome small subunit-dependent GTPase A [Streptomyces sp. CS207]QCR50269.1 ribosome small subunit-dependent GTPase A [Streptomyces sp. SGAir0924]RSS31483.1 ribosome small subunit-dependent GTPase A [Streptomyces sp. WAC08452]